MGMMRFSEAKNLLPRNELEGAERTLAARVRGNRSRELLAVPDTQVVVAPLDGKHETGRVFPDHLEIEDINDQGGSILGGAVLGPEGEGEEVALPVDDLAPPPDPLELE